MTLSKKIPAMVVSLAIVACNTDPVSNLNQVAPGLTHTAFQSRVLGMLFDQRFDFGTRVPAMDGFGRNAANFTTTDMRFITEWLGDGTPVENSTFYGTTNWVNQFNAIRQGQGVLTDLPNAIPAYSAGDVAKIKGMVYTLEAISYMYATETRDTLGVPINGPLQANPLVPAPILCARDAWRAIIALLDSGLTQLNTDPSAGLPIDLGPGFAAVNAMASPSTAPGAFAALNRAMAARANLELAYATARGPGGSPPGATTSGAPDATALNRADSALHASSLYDPTQMAPPGNANFTEALAVYYTFSGASGDLPNPMQALQPTYYVLKEAVADIDTADKRLAKIFTNPAGAAGTSYNTVASPLTLAMYQDPASPIPLIRNEELNLIEAEIRLGLNDLAGTTTAVNAVRTSAGGLPAVAMFTSYAQARDQILKELRASTLGEPNGARAQAIRDYELAATLNVTWGTKDTHATVQPIPVNDVTTRNGNTTPTCQ